MLGSSWAEAELEDTLAGGDKKRAPVAVSVESPQVWGPWMETTVFSVLTCILLCRSALGTSHHEVTLMPPVHKQGGSSSREHLPTPLTPPPTTAKPQL